MESSQASQRMILTAPMNQSLGIILRLDLWMNRLTQARLARMKISYRDRNKQQLHLRPQASLELLPPFLNLLSSLLDLKPLLSSLLNDGLELTELLFYPNELKRTFNRLEVFIE